MSARRYTNLSFPYPFVFGKFGLVIPTPSSQGNAAAVLKPFQYQVHITLSFACN